MKKTKYGQCSMVRSTPTGVERTVSYLPEKFAYKGSVVKLKNENDEWSDGWVIQDTPTMFTDSPPDYRKAIRNHKKETGDSLPKD